MLEIEDDGLVVTADRTDMRGQSTNAWTKRW